MSIKRTIIIVFDSVGAGELPDAKAFGDVGSNTLANTALAVGGLDLPNLGRLGLGNIIDIAGVPPAKEPKAAFGKLAEVSSGKDTTVGHWELMGIWSRQPFPVYPRGFPPELIETFTSLTGLKILGNKAASGTAIIAELGEEHLRTGRPIVYTSADSVWQIAAHEEIIPVDDLYRLCGIAREMLVGKHGVARVIARPFVGAPGAFERTHRRRDFSIAPPSNTLLDFAVRQGIPVLAAGKISEIFAGRGISESLHTADNNDTIDLTLEYMSRGPAENGKAIIFANLVDFDMLWGHRNDPAGYAAGLVSADMRLPEILSRLREDDLLIITADHGCDPTTPSTDHSREYVPILLYGAAIESGVDLGIRSTFADVAQTIAEAMGIVVDIQGHSMWQLILEGKGEKGKGK
jgi:phosphopentomutase